MIGGLKRRKSYGSMDQMNQHSYSLATGKRIILTTLLLSIIIHVSIVAALHDISPFTILKSELRTYKVDLMRPPIKEIEKALKEAHDPAPSQDHGELPVETKDATISLDTKDSKYYPYAKVIKEKIFNYWVYPLSAKKNLIQGNCLIVFRLDRNGNLIECDVGRSSGHEILDRHALNAVRLAHPFPPFPENITVQFLNIHASFTYQLTFGS